MTNPVYFVFGHFDAQCVGNFENLRRQVSTEVVPLFPHITLGGYDRLPLDTLINWVRTFADSQSPLKITFNHIGWFPGGIWFIAPRVNRALLDFHRAYHANYDSCLKRVGYNYSLCSENWVPHVSVFSPEEKPAAEDVCKLLSAFQPFSGEMTALSVYEENSDQALARFDLRQISSEGSYGES